MNRCIGITKSGKKCRAPVQEGRECKFYCCKSHEPFNMDFFQMGCFVCCETEFKSNELTHLKCGHVLHKSCYTEWFLEHSTYEGRVCMICRFELYKKEGDSIEIKEFYKNKKGVKKKAELIMNYRSFLDKIQTTQTEVKPLLLEFPLK
jgi:hypothetical protein